MSDNARSKLQKFPKDVIIDAFLRVAFFRADDIVEECEAIQRANKLNALMTRSEELSDQVLTLLKDEPRGKRDEYFEWIHAVQKLQHEQSIIQNKIDKLFEMLS